MSTTDRTQPTRPAALTPATLKRAAEALLDDAIGIQEDARGWLAETQASPHVDEATRAGALEAATSIDITVEGLGWGTQALHRAADPDAPPWQREAPEPLVTHTDGTPAPTDTAQVEGEPAARAELSARAGFLAAELDDLGQEIGTLTNATRGWLDDGADTRDGEVLEHGQRADKNLTTSILACSFANGQTEAIADDLTDTRTSEVAGVIDDATHLSHAVDEAQNGLSDIRGHQATSTSRNQRRGIDTAAVYDCMVQADAERDVGRGPVLEQEPPF